MKFMRTHSWEKGKRCLLLLIFSYYISHKVLKLNEYRKKKIIHLPTCTFFWECNYNNPKRGTCGYMYMYCAWLKNFANNKAQHYPDILLYFHCNIFYLFDKSICYIVLYFYLSLFVIVNTYLIHLKETPSSLCLQSLHCTSFLI